MKSPWKKKTKKIPVAWNLIPRYDELVKALDDSYRSKAKDRMKLPVINFINWHNNNNSSGDMGWLSSLLQSGNHESLSLLSYFCYGKETESILLQASSKNANDDIPGFRLFEEKLLDAPLLGIENGNDLKSMLLAAVRNSYYFDNNNNNNMGHPIAKFLSVVNRQHGNGWLLNLGNKRTTSRTNRDKFIATALYNIIGGGCKLEYCDILASALGSKANSPDKRKTWIRDIARDTAKEIMNTDNKDDRSNNGMISATTATTASTSSLTAPTILITQPAISIASPLSSTTQADMQSKRPPSLITQNLDQNQMSPLTGYSRESEGNFFPASSSSTPMNGTEMLIETPSKSFNSPPPKMQYKTPSKELSTASMNMSFDNKQQESPSAGDYDPLSLSFGPDESNTLPVLLFKEKLTRPPPSPAMFSPLAQPKDKRRRRSSIISPDRFRRKDTVRSRTPVEKLRHCLDNRENDCGNDDDIRAAAIDYLFGEDCLFEKLNSMTNSNTRTKKKVLSDAINFISKNTNADGSISNSSKTFVQVVRPKARSKDSKPASYKKYIKRKAADVKKVVGTLFGNNEDVGKDVLAHVLSNDYNQVVFEEADSDVKISALDVVEVRNRAGFKVASSVVVSIMKDTTSLLIKNNKLRVEKSPFEGQLRKKIGRLEKAGAVPSTFEYVECYITQENTGTCTYYYIEDVPLLIERLVAGCLMEGRYEDSIDISIFNNKIIIRFGCDRGGGDLIMGISLANRKKGNSGMYSIPIGVVEGATEVRSNLEKTVYSRARRAILEQLVNQHLFMVRLFFYEEDGSTIRDVKCILLMFNCIGITREELSKTKFVCTIDENVLNDGVVEWQSKALGRSVADQVLINTNMFFGLQDDEQQQHTFFGNNNSSNHNNNGDSQLNITINLVKVEDMYVGCKIFATRTTEEIFSFEFDNGVDINEKDSTNIHGDCLQLIGAPSEDGKMCDCVYGLSTCSASYPCPKCDWNLKDKSLPLWMKDFGSNTITNCTDFSPRTGTTSRDACHKNFKKLRGERTATDPATVESKRSVLSVVNEPLLHIDDDLLYLHNGEPMHVTQGCMTHLTKQTATQLELLKLDGEDDFISELTVKVDDFIQSMDELQTSNDYKKSRAGYNKEDRLVKKLHNQYKEAVENDEEEDVIDEHYKEFEDAASTRDALGEHNGYLSMMKRIQGGQELKLLMITFNKSKKKNFNKAAYIFMKAVKTFAGDFNKGHGVHELTNALGIRALEKRQDIYDTVINGCNSVDVANVMNWWLTCADLLYDISIMLKSQDKLVEEDIHKLKDLVVDYVYTWKKQLETYIDSRRNPIFWKMHMLCCGLIEFVEKTGMAGRCSAEGFENKHHVMNQIKRLMAPIALDKLRCEKLSQRQQSCLIPGIADVQNFFEREDKRVSTGIRGPYKSRGTRTKLLENLPLQATVEKEAEDGYFISSQDNLIPENLADIYLFMIHGKVPDEWAQTFHDSSSLGTKAANSAPYIPI